MYEVPVGVTLSLSRNAPSVTSTSPPPGKSPTPVLVTGLRNKGFTVVEPRQKRLERLRVPEMMREKRVVEHVPPHLVEAADTCVAGRSQYSSTSVGGIVAAAAGA